MSPKELAQHVDKFMISYTDYPSPGYKDTHKEMADLFQKIWDTACQKTMDEVAVKNIIDRYPKFNVSFL